MPPEDMAPLLAQEFAKLDGTEQRDAASGTLSALRPPLHYAKGTSISSGMEPCIYSSENRKQTWWQAGKADAHLLKINERELMKLLRRRIKFHPITDQTLCLIGSWVGVPAYALHHSLHI